MIRTKVLFLEIMNLTFSEFGQLKVEAFRSIEDLMSKIKPQDFQELTSFSIEEYTEQIIPKITDEEENIEIKLILLRFLLSILEAEENGFLMQRLAEHEMFLNELLYLLDVDNPELTGIVGKILELLQDKIDY
jgi:hypothetical protein